MANEDPRPWPLIEVGSEQIRSLLSPILAGAAIGDVSQVAGGLINTIYRVTPADGGPALALRIFPAGRCPCETERRILARLGGSLAVPEVVLADCAGAGFTHPYLVYRWIEGITLNDCRRRTTPEELLSLAEPLGRLLAGVAAFAGSEFFEPDRSLERSERSSLATLLAANEERLLRGRARRRLGGPLADALWRRLTEGATRFEELDRTSRLVHGDLSGRNILVKPTAANEWHVCGLIDWESAFAGWPLWDVGSLFRYPRRYSEAFRRRFERGYRQTGGALPEDWWRTARLLDATRQIATLDEVRELPRVFADCRGLIEAVAAE